MNSIEELEKEILHLGWYMREWAPASPQYQRMVLRMKSLKQQLKKLKKK